MTRKQLKRLARAFVGRKTVLDGKTAEKIVTAVLADGFVSRTERRLLGGLLRSVKVDKTARLALHQVLADGS